MPNLYFFPVKLEGGGVGGGHITPVIYILCPIFSDYHQPSAYVPLYIKINQQKKNRNLNNQKRNQKQNGTNK